MNDGQILLRILLPALITFALRLLPFLLFGKKRSMTLMVDYLGETLPYAIMAALVVYCLKGLETGVSVTNVATVISVAVVAMLHLWRKNTILSITLGTFCYMMLIRMLG